MGGIYIRCGSFEGDDKCGSSIEALADELTPQSASEASAIDDVRRALEGEADADYGRVAANHAKNLITLLSNYVQEIQLKYGPIGDPFEFIDRDFAENPSLDPTDAKYGKSRGWRYYCAVNLLKACETSWQESEDVIFTWD